MEPTEYLFVGGPLDGQTHEFTGTASWWGFRYEKDGIVGEYNTRVLETYSGYPYTLYWWEEGTERRLKPDWVLEDSVDNTAVDDHIKRMLDGEQG